MDSLLLLKLVILVSSLKLEIKYLKNAFSHDYNTRHRGKLNPPFARLEICKRSFLCKGICLWNDLGDDVKFNNFNSFKKMIKCKLIDESE